jgi:purine-binding chemotaxis protein CheW
LSNNQDGFWLILVLADQKYALPLKQVAEVLRMVALTRLPQAPAHILGVINLRARIIPVIDLRARLSLPPRALGLDARLVVVEVEGRPLALLADDVAEVVNLPAAHLDAPDNSIGSAHPLLGTLQVGDQVVLALDLLRLCAGVEAPLEAGD